MSDLDSEMASENDEEVPPNDDASSSLRNDSKDDSSPGSSKKDQSLELAHRDILEKLTRDDDDDEIDVDAQKDVKQGSETLAQDLRLNSGDDEAHQDKDNSRVTTPTQTEIKNQRPPGLLAQHGLMTHKNHGAERHNNVTDSAIGPRDPRDFLHPQLRDIAIKSELNPLGSQPPPPAPTAAHPLAPLDFTHPAYLERQFSRPPSTPESPPSIGLPNGDALGTHTGGHHWTFEEQFKQVSECLCVAVII